MGIKKCVRALDYLPGAPELQKMQYDARGLDCNRKFLTKPRSTPITLKKPCDPNSFSFFSALSFDKSFPTIFNTFGLW